MPMDSDYDLHGMSSDGRRRPQLTDAVTRDDVIRAADGAFFGTAEAP